MAQPSLAPCPSSHHILLPIRDWVEPWAKPKKSQSPQEWARTTSSLPPFLPKTVPQSLAFPWATLEKTLCRYPQVCPCLLATLSTTHQVLG